MCILILVTGSSQQGSDRNSQVSPHGSTDLVRLRLPVSPSITIVFLYCANYSVPHFSLYFTWSLLFCHPGSSLGPRAWIPLKSSFYPMPHSLYLWCVLVQEGRTVVAPYWSQKEPAHQAHPVLRNETKPVLYIKGIKTKSRGVRGNICSRVLNPFVYKLGIQRKEWFQEVLRGIKFYKGGVQTRWFVFSYIHELMSRISTIQQ